MSSQNLQGPHVASMKLWIESFPTLNDTCFESLLQANYLKAFDERASRVH